VGFLITDARRTGLKVLGPNINRSDVEFTVEHTRRARAVIRMGLSVIKNVGEDAVAVICGRTESKRTFKSLDDLASRVDLRKLNARLWDISSRPERWMISGGVRPC
jgi:DNA polymerase-3 subunit alpha